MSVWRGLFVLILCAGVAAADEPRDLHALADTPGLVPSTAEDQARFLVALDGEIGEQLAHLAGVADATVIVNRAPVDPLAPPAMPRSLPTASVVLRVAGAAQVSIPDVQRLVAAAVAGLRPEAVTVVLSAVPAPVAAVAPSELTTVGPIQVAKGSRGALVGILSGGCLVIVALGVWILFAERRLAKRA